VSGRFVPLGLAVKENRRALPCAAGAGSSSASSSAGQSRPRCAATVMTSAEGIIELPQIAGRSWRPKLGNWDSYFEVILMPMSKMRAFRSVG
jgi:hypothetical protein